MHRSPSAANVNSPQKIASKSFFMIPPDELEDPSDTLIFEAPVNVRTYSNPDHDFEDLLDGMDGRDLSTSTAGGGEDGVSVDSDEWDDDDDEVYELGHDAPEEELTGVVSPFEMSNPLMSARDKSAVQRPHTHTHTLTPHDIKSTMSVI